MEIKITNTKYDTERNDRLLYIVLPVTTNNTNRIIYSHIDILFISILAEHFFFVHLNDTSSSLVIYFKKLYFCSLNQMSLFVILFVKLIISLAYLIT